MRYLLILLLLCCSFSTCFAQGKLVLQHKKRPKKQIDFPIQRTFSFKVNDSTYYYGRVTAFDKETITITQSDSVSNQVLMSDIEYMTRDKMANTRWMDPFAYFLLGAGMVIAATPIIWAVDGGDKALEGLEFAGILTAVTIPPLWYGSRQERYNLQKKWRIVIQE